MEFNKHLLEGYDIQFLYNREDVVPPTFKSLTFQSWYEDPNIILTLCS